MKKFLVIFSIIAVASCNLLPEENITPFISNGIRANLGEFPYQVLIGMFTDTTSSICSGTLIKHQWVLTVKQF
jgi:secreted trypsin-like serine protease